jgi:hypothetical protein
LSPRIPCKAWWGERTSCGFPYRKPHTRPWLGPRSRKSGSFALFAKGGIRDRRYRDSWYPTLRKKREGWGTRGFVALPAEYKKCPVSYPAGRQRRYMTLKEAAHTAVAGAAQQEIRGDGAPADLLHRRSLASWMRSQLLMSALHDRRLPRARQVCREGCACRRRPRLPFGQAMQPRRLSA